MASAISIGIALAANTSKFDEAMGKAASATADLSKRYSQLDKQTSRPLAAPEIKIAQAVETQAVKPLASPKLVDTVRLQEIKTSAMPQKVKSIKPPPEVKPPPAETTQPRTGLGDDLRLQKLKPTPAMKPDAEVAGQRTSLPQIKTIKPAPEVKPVHVEQHTAGLVDTLYRPQRIKQPPATDAHAGNKIKQPLTAKSIAGAEMLETFHPSQRAVQQKLLDQHTENIGNKIKPSPDAGSIGNKVKPPAQPVMPTPQEGGGVAGAVAAGTLLAGVIVGVAKAATQAAESLGKFVAAQDSAAIDSLKLSRALGISTEALRTIEQGVKDLGGDASSVSGALSTMSRLIQGSVAGNISAAQSLSQLGLAASDLVKLSPDQQFAKVAESVAGIADPAQRAASAFSIFGDKAGEMLPLLSQGKAGLDAARESMEGLANNVKSVDATNLETISIELGKAEDFAAGLGAQIAVGLIPNLQSAIDYMKSFGLSGANSGSMITNAIDKVVYMFFSINDILLVIRSGLNWLDAGFAEMVKNISNGIGYLLEVAGKLPDKLGGKMFRDAAQGVRDFAKVAGDQADRYAAEAAQNFADANTRITGPQKIAELRAAADAAAKLANEARSAGGAVSKLNINMEHLKLGEHLREGLITPLQAFRAELDKLSAAMDLRLISTDQYALGIARAATALEDAHKLQEMRLPGAALRDTTEAYSAIARSESQDKYARESPADRALRIQEQSLAVEQMQLEYAKKIADALGAKPKVASIK